MILIKISPITSESENVLLFFGRITFLFEMPVWLFPNRLLILILLTYIFLKS